MWQSMFEAVQLNDCAASFIQARLPEIGMTLFQPNGTAGSFLILVIIVALILGVPLILIALRVIEIISEKRHDAASQVDEESAGEENSEVEKKPAKDAGEWTPAKHMR
jgi:flagellar biosynthesis/type III secretory pathway M-ring protein FliF/YscJ